MDQVADGFHEMAQRAKEDCKMNRHEFLQREAEGFARRGMDEDREAEARQEYWEMRRRRRNLSCTDGMCGAEDCCRCRPGSYRFATDEENLEWEDQ